MYTFTLAENLLLRAVPYVLERGLELHNTRNSYQNKALAVWITY